MTASEMTPADFGAVCGNNNDGFGGNGAWWIIILFLFAICGGWSGNGFGGFGGGNEGSSIKDQYVLSSDFATIQRQLSDGFNSIDNALDRQNAGICDLGYTQLNLANTLNTETSINISTCNTFSIERHNAKSKIIWICFSELRNVISNSAL